MRAPCRNARTRYSASLCLLLAMSCLAAPSWADILVTHDGQRIETDGPWEVKGRQVVFTTATGVLSAMRLTEVDLEASEKATNWQAPPPPPVTYKEEQPRLGEMSQKGKDRSEATIVLTNEDVGSAHTKELEALARIFGGAMMTVLEQLGEKAADSGEISADLKREFDREMSEQGRIIQQDYENALLAIAGVAKTYPELQELEPSNRDSVKKHANAIASAAKELRVAAHQAQTAPAAQLLNEVAGQFQGLLVGID